MGGNNWVENKFLFVGAIIGGCIAVILICHTVIWAPLDLKITQEAQARCSGDNAVEAKLDKMQEDVTIIRIAIARIIR